MKIYIGGKITGLPIPVYKQKFNEARQKVKDMYPDAEVIIPTDLCADDTGWAESMEICLDTLWGCDIICFTPDWQDSQGSLIERKIAEKLGRKIIYLK